MTSANDSLVAPRGLWGQHPGSRWKRQGIQKTKQDVSYVLGEDYET